MQSLIERDKQMMKKNYAFKIMETLMFLILACSSIGCIAFGSELSPKRMEEANEEDVKWQDWVAKYIKDVLYFRMPVDEFVRLFTKDASWTEPEKPYIISHDGNQYIIIGRKQIKYRVTFKDGLLEKLEQYVRNVIPLVPLPVGCYADFSHLLKGYKSPNASGFYDGMSEEEFLQVFSDAILSHSKNSYVIVGKNGRKYRITFSSKGYLIGMQDVGK